MGEGPQQAGVVALVQADGGLVQDVHDAHQAGADLAGEPDALGLAAGQGIGAALQGEVVEAHVHQKPQALGDLLDDLGADLAMSAGQGEGLEEAEGLADGQGGESRQVVVGDQDVTRGLVKTGAGAVGTGLLGEVAGEFFAHRVGVGVPVAAFHVADDALEGPRLAGPAFVGQGEFDFFPPGAVEDELAYRFRQVLPRGLHVEAVMGAQGADQLEVVGVAPVPSADGPPGETCLWPAHDFGRIEELFGAQAVAGGAGARRVVEGEQPGLQLRDAVAAEGAGEGGGEQEFLVVRRVDPGHPRQAIGEAQRGLEGLGEP